MTEFAFSLKIETVGAREALNALNDLDKRGRKIVEDASGALGKSMGAVAVAYETGGKKMRQALETVADGHRAAIREALNQERAVGTLERRQATASLSAARGLEQIARTSNLASSSLDTVLAQTSQIAFGFGPTGAIVGAIGVSVAAIVSLFQRASEESKKLADDMLASFQKIAHMDLIGQGQQAALLYSGDPNAVGSKNLAEFGIPELRRQQAALERRASARMAQGGPGGTTMVLTEDAREAAAALDKVKARLAEIVPLYQSLYGVGGRGGSLERAAKVATAGDQPGFTTDALKAGLKLDKKGRQEAEREAAESLKAFARFMAAKFQEAKQRMIEDLQVGADIRQAMIDEMIPTKEQLKQAMDEIVFELNRALDSDPILNAMKKAQELGERIGQVIADGIGGGIASAMQAGFERAFSGEGATGFIKGFGQAILGALAGILTQVGAALITFGIGMTIVAQGLKNPLTSGPAMIAAGILLTGLGAALSAAVSGRGGGGGGGGSFGGGYGGGSSLPQIIDRGIIDPSSYSDARGAGMTTTARGGDTFVFYGPNDPQAVRWLDEIDKKRQQSGSLVPRRA